MIGDSHTSDSRDEERTHRSDERARLNIYTQNPSALSVIVSNDTQNTCIQGPVRDSSTHHTYVTLK
jgi:hypothetical protein